MAFPKVKVTPATSGTDVNTLPDAGQKTMADSLSVTLASNQGPLSVQGTVYAHVDFTAPQHVIIDSMPSVSSSPDVTDRVGRLLGHVTVDNASLAVTGTFWQATQPVSGTFWQATQPVSIASMPSTPVTGTFWPGTQPVSGTFWQATQPVSLATNTPDVTDRSARLLGHVTVDNAALAVTGTFFQATQPVSVAALPLPSGAATSAKQPALGTAGTASADVLSVQGVTAMTALKVDGSGVTQPVSGTFWPATQPVSGTFWQTTQPVSIASMPSTPVTGTFWQATQPVSGTFWQATQPVSGTVTANAGTNLNTSALALDATLTGGTQTTRITDGTNTATVKAASTAAVAADKAVVIAVSPNNTVGVTGTFWQATQPVSGTFWQATQPISAASLPLPTGAALDATLTGGTATVRITDGTNTATVKAASTAPAAADKAVVVVQSPNGYIASVARLASAAATTNATLVKNAAGRVFKIRGYNAKAAVCYLKLYNKATAPTPASDNALLMASFALKASDMFDIDFTPQGYGFSTGIGYALTGASSDTDATALVAADIVGLNIFYA